MAPPVEGPHSAAGSGETDGGVHGDATAHEGLRLVASRLLTADELAERWQVERSHVYRLTRRGVLPAVSLGRYYRYRLDAIERFEIAGGVTADV